MTPRLPRLTTLALALLAASLPLSGAGALLATDAAPADDLAPVPLAAPAPAWWTPEVHERALLAAEAGLAYDYEAGEAVDLAAAYPAEAFLRPGTPLLITAALNRGASLCTAAFTFDQRTLISTAGHCIDVGETAFAVAAPHTVVFRVGTAVASTGNGGIGNDWALIAIAPQWQPYTDSDAAWIGGPHGVADPMPTARPTLLKHVGNGLVVGTGGTPRAGLLAGANDAVVSFEGVVEGGDSGSPLLLVGTPGQEDDAAAGIITHKMCDRCTRAYATRVTLIPATLDDGNGLPN